MRGEMRRGTQEGEERNRREVGVEEGRGQEWERRGRAEQKVGGIGRGEGRTEGQEREI